MDERWTYYAKGIHLMEKDKYCMTSLIHQNKTQDNTKQKQALRYKEHIGVYMRGRRVGGSRLGEGGHMYGDGC